MVSIAWIAHTPEWRSPGPRAITSTATRACGREGFILTRKRWPGPLCQEIEARREAVRFLYSTPDAKAAEKTLRCYHVGWVYFGWLERQTYPAAGLRKFDEARDLFQLA